MTLRKESFWQAARFTDERDMRGGPLSREEVYGSRNAAAIPAVQNAAKFVHVKSWVFIALRHFQHGQLKLKLGGRGGRHHSNGLEEAGPLDYRARRTDGKRH